MARPRRSRTARSPAVDLDALAALRHDLCTPASHIQGYAEMLQEEAGEGGCAEWIPDLKRIEQAGRRLVQVVREQLSAERVARAAPDLRELHAALRTPLNHVVGYGEILREQAAVPGREVFLPDLDRILAAARTFLELLTSRVSLEAPGLKPAPASLPEGANTARRRSAARSSRAIRDGGSAARVGVGTGRLLLIEDDSANRELLERRLRRQGFEVVTAASGRAGLRRARAGGFDLVLLDLVMPGMGGDRVLAAFKSDPAMAELPVIMLSAADDLDAVVRCLLMGAEDYLAKPFNAVLLRARISACLEKVRLRRHEQEVLLALERERRKSEELLLNILPQPIAERLKQGATTIVDELPDVTVLFADLVGFTELARRVDSVAMVRLLDDLFSGFDRLAQARGLEKIKTIGDAYMVVVGGLPLPRADHAEAMADLALAMVKQVASRAQDLGQTLDVRIGIHCGPVIAGIIGRQKFSYDLWGDTVNTASRMESHGLPGCIQVTEDLARRLEPGFQFECRGEIVVKGRGAMTPWILKGRRT